MYGAGDVRIENVPDAQLDRADRRARTRHPRRDLRQRSLAVQGNGADRVRPPHGPRVHRRRRGRRRRRPLGRSQGELVVSPFLWSDGSCVFCREGLHSECLHGGRYGFDDVDGGQGEAVRVPQADGTLVVLPAVGDDDALMPSLLTLSDVMGTGHHAAVAAKVRLRFERRGRRRRRGRALRRHRREAARRRADHPPREPRRADHARAGVRRHRCRPRAWRGGCRARPRADRRPWRALGARMRRTRAGARNRASRSRARAAPSAGSACPSTTIRRQARVLEERRASAVAPRPCAPTSRSSSRTSSRPDRAGSRLRPGRRHRRGPGRLPGDERPRGDQGDGDAVTGGGGRTRSGARGSGARPSADAADRRSRFRSSPPRHGLRRSSSYP